ncbi:conjugal transfer protein TraG N-terminal domain-containing protein [Rugamonas aquatica]|uniref:Conjugal transfer protein TraG n=1 Tax=Rugamonas aquatica TaxID=2743357 RepID=A0A6A7N660_9BURK|nr:conjugal transfer protein TraG N-terminal domain-containing protein [Rugamonas aquatica]MQA40584.1 conjugal transfer protein TraG [Rugamonas aquatica]
MSMPLEVYCYGNGASLAGVFNAIAMVSGAGNFAIAVGFVLVCGFIIAMLAYALAPQRLAGWQWLASMTLVLTVLFVPKQEVAIIEIGGVDPPRIVDHVPLGVASLSSMISTLFHALTDLIETSFQTIPISGGVLPAELSYQKNGLMFGSRVVTAVNAVKFSDPVFRADLLNFIIDCTAPDLAMPVSAGGLDPKAFAQATDVWAMMASPNPARFTSITTNTGPVLKTCPDAYAILNTAMPGHQTTLLAWLAQKLHPTTAGGATAADMSDEVQQAYLRAGLATASDDAQKIVLQAAMINAIGDAAQLDSAHSGDTSAVLIGLGEAQALRQTNMTWQAYAKVAEQALPVVRNVIEAMLYAMFPIVVLLLMLTYGRETARAVGNYAEIMIWIQLWPPLYAILNYISSIYAQQDLLSSAYVASGIYGLTLQSKAIVDSTSLSGQAVVGYLTVSIPFLAWSLLKRMETFGTAVAGGLTALQGTLSSTVGAAAAGNASLGNLTLGQVNASPSMSSPFFTRNQDHASGDTTTRNVLSGRESISRLMNQGAGEIKIAHRVSSQEATDAKRSTLAAEQRMQSDRSAVSTARVEALTWLSHHGGGVRNNDGVSTDQTQSVLTSLADVRGIAEQHAKDWNISTDEGVQLLLKSGVEGGASLGMIMGAVKAAGLPKPIQKLANAIDVGVKGEASGGYSWKGGMTESQKQALATLNQDELRKVGQVGKAVREQNGWERLLQSDTQSGKDIAARLQRAESAEKASSAEFNRAMQYSESVSHAVGDEMTVSIDLARSPDNPELFHRLNSASRPDGQAAFLNYANAIAAAQTTVARGAVSAPVQFKDGTQVPQSAEEVELQYQKALERLRSEADIVAVHTANARLVPGAPAPEQVRPNVEALVDPVQMRKFEDKQQAHRVQYEKDFQATVPSFDKSAGRRAKGELKKVTDGLYRGKSVVDGLDGAKPSAVTKQPGPSDKH